MKYELWGKRMPIKNMSLSMSMDKDERMFKMRNDIKIGKTLTVRSCEKSMLLSRWTILQYLKELNMSIYGTEKKDMTKKFNDETKVICPF